MPETATGSRAQTSRAQPTSPDEANRQVTSVVVADTSTLVADPDGIFDAYPAADLVVPLTVVEELDGLKKRVDPVGAAARAVLRRLERFRSEAGGQLDHGCPRPVGGTVRVELNGIHGALIREHGLDPDKADNRIIGAALSQQAGDRAVSLVSNDTAVRVKAATFGLTTAEHDRLHGERRNAGDRGWQELEVEPGVIDACYGHADLASSARPVLDALRPNEFGVLRAGSQSALVRRVGDGLRQVRTDSSSWELRPRNKEQRFALDLCTDDDVRLVALDGPAGTGKTLVAVAAALQQVIEDGRYQRICVYRPVVPVGKAEVGYLPGTLDEKLDPWMAAITDAVSALTDGHNEETAARVLAEIRARGQLTMESVTHLRGRTLHASFVIVDEAMNLSPQVGKTILTRIAADSKIVFTGDTSQIDAAFLSEQTNALSSLITAFGAEACFGHVRLERGERSPLAELAARLL